jgi:hypothetical protein
VLKNAEFFYFLFFKHFHCLSQSMQLTQFKNAPQLNRQPMNPKEERFEKLKERPS